MNKLQKSHLQNVPFENLDIHTGKKIELENTYDKIVNRGRGGFCYELNGLFYLLLKKIGFTVKLISARPFNSNTKEFGPEFDHMAIIAEINSAKYLVDVGFGEFTLLPLKIELNTLQNDSRGNFIIEKYDDTYLIVKKITGENFHPEYIFTETEWEFSDFNEMCNYHQTNSNSHFTQKRICSLPAENGRITISGNTLKITENDKVTEIQLNNEEEFNKRLWDHFKIKL